MAKWCDEGETSVGDVYLGEQTNPPKYLGLYTNTTEPAEGAALTAITEPSGNGYARIQLAAGDWTEQATKGVFKNVQKTFTAAGGSWGNVYGYFVCTVATGTAGKLIEVEQFTDGPYLVNDGWIVRVTAQITIS